jgi:hypothetical protein
VSFLRGGAPPPFPSSPSEELSPDRSSSDTLSNPELNPIKRCVGDPDPHVFVGLPDPDPLVRGTDPDPSLFS